MIEIKVAQAIQCKPKPWVNSSQKPLAPALIPTMVKNRVIPISLKADKAADGNLQWIRLKVMASPKRANKIATTKVPPITPNFIGAGTPGSGIGIEPNNIPKNRPIKIGIIAT